MSLIEALRNYQTIETTRLVLRRIVEEDLNDIFEFSSDPEVTKFISWETHYSLDQTRHLMSKFLESYKQNEIRDWGVELKENQKLIGFAGFLPGPRDINAPDIGYILNRDYWNRHLATEAVQKIVEFGFEIASLNKITAECAEQHLPSQKVLLNNGFSFEKNDIIKTQRGTTERIKLFSILLGDFQGKRRETKCTI